MGAQEVSEFPDTKMTCFGCGGHISMDGGAQAFYRNKGYMGPGRCNPRRQDKKDSLVDGHKKGSNR